MKTETMNNAYIPRYSKRKADRSEIVDSELIFNAVQNHFGITRECLFKKSKKVEVVYPRQVCIYLLAKYSIHTIPGIAVLFDQKDHTSALNSVTSIENYLSYDDLVKDQLESIVKSFKL